MKTVWKHTARVDDATHEVVLPGWGRVVHVEPLTQTTDMFWFWTEHEVDAGPEMRILHRVYGTGHEVPADAVHLGTCQVLSRPLVWHLYDVTDVAGEDA